MRIHCCGQLRLLDRAAKRFRWLSLAVLAAALAACGQGAPSPAATEAVALPPATTQAPAVDGVPGAATQPASGQDEAFSWEVTIAQGEQTFPPDALDVPLARAPFTIQVRVPQPMALKLNALDTDQNFQLIQPGFELTEDCFVALCTGMDVAEEALNPIRDLFVDPLSTHYLYYQSETDHRWNRVTVTDQGALMERDVALLNGVPIEQYGGQALFVLLFANPENPGMIDPGELKKITLLFQ